jgi:hypothetical protein
MIEITNFTSQTGDEDEEFLKNIVLRERLYNTNYSFFKKIFNLSDADADMHARYIASDFLDRMGVIL